MKTIHVPIPPHDDSYDIEIVNNFLEGPYKYLEDVKVSSFVIISDSAVSEIYGKQIIESLKDKVERIEMLIIPAGEESKNWEQVGELVRKMVQMGFDRKCTVLALGGGVVGDLAGFVARVFLRGVSFVQIPTSLLAMVDSSVGGKTGVDIPEGKNLVGAFYQPKKVIIDLSFLSSLSEKQLQIGLAEVIKYGVIWDADFFSYLEENMEAILERDEQCLEKIIRKSVEIKAEAVSKDEQESGLRMMLNFGHTYGHAIELLSEFKLSHGEAVAVGMHFACRLVEEKGFAATNRVCALIEKAGLPIHYENNFTHEEILAVMKKDKKASKGEVRFVLPKTIGEVYVEKVGDDELLGLMGEFNS